MNVQTTEKLSRDDFPLASPRGPSLLEISSIVPGNVENLVQKCGTLFPKCRNLVRKLEI